MKDATMHTARKALMETLHELNFPIDKLLSRLKYFRGRRIDRKEVFARKFAGENLKHEEMFSSRGYRGLNVLPYPQHVKEQIKQGFIGQRDAQTFSRHDGIVDYTDYELVNKYKKKQSSRAWACWKHCKTSNNTVA